MEKRDESAAKNIHGVGRRKSAVARVWLKKGSGKISINGEEYKKYFPTKLTKDMVALPFKVLGIEKNFDVDVNVYGGGPVGQAGAVRLGVSRALLKTNSKAKEILRKHGLLTVDSRVKERKKYGQKGARRKFQFVKR
ncbi:30S ribosomal protein S9 [Candidatus Dependentiae bacterium]|nr:30S ribosomal protein S9 [Candidatus Dependentiae bacterium]